MKPILPHEGYRTAALTPEPDDDRIASGPFSHAILVMQQAAHSRRDPVLFALGDALTYLYDHDNEVAIEMLLDWLVNEVRPDGED